MKTTQYSAADLERGTLRSRNKRWAAALSAITREAEAFAAQAPEVPLFDGSWYDPDVPYSQTYQQFHDYVLPHRPLYQATSRHLLAGMLCQQDRWRRQALELALGYAEAVDFKVTHYDSGMEYGYLITPLCDVFVGAGDLFKDDESERALVCLRQAADAILRCSQVWQTELHHMPFNNHRICHMARLLALGHILEDSSLVDPVFDSSGAGSFLNYLDGAAYDDGLCYESSLHYHYATTGFLFSTASVQRSLLPERTDLFQIRGAVGRNLLDYLLAPIKTCFNGYTLPPVGDSYGQWQGLATISQLTRGYGIYQNPELAAIIGENMSSSPLLNLIYGPEETLPNSAEKRESRLFPEHGYALLRDDDCLHKQIFLSGDRSGIHHHRDSLQLMVELGEQIILGPTYIQPSTLHGFSDRIQDEFNRCAHAHSQLQVDNLDQKTHASPLSVREWSTDGHYLKRVAMTDEHAVLQDGIHQGRFVSMADGWICDCVVATSINEHTWRLFYHLPAGEATSDTDTDTDTDTNTFCEDIRVLLPEGAPWTHLKTNAGMPAATSHRWCSGQARFATASNRNHHLQRFTVAVDNSEELSHGVFAEQRGQHAVFLTLYTHIPTQGDAELVDLSVQQLGNELVARWGVVAATNTHRHQARLLIP